MIIEKLIFNFLALFFFVFIFFKMIKKNDTSYITLLIIQMIGISLNFLEIIFNIFTEISNKIIMYLFSVILPLIVCYLETKNIVFLEIKNITLAKICMILKLDKKAKKLLIDLNLHYEFQNGVIYRVLPREMDQVEPDDSIILMDPQYDCDIVKLVNSPYQIASQKPLAKAA